MNVEEIVKNYLIENKFDGLVDPCESCGCGIDDLMPCDCPNFNECEVAVFNTKDKLFYPANRHDKE